MGRDGAVRPCPRCSLPAARRLLSQDSPSGQRRAVLARCPLQGHEVLGRGGGCCGYGVPVLSPPLAQVWDGGGRSHGVDLTALGKHGRVYTEGRAPSQNTPRMQVRVARLVAPLAAPVPRWALAPCPCTRALRLPGLVPLGDAAALRGREEPAQATKTQPVACAGGSRAGRGGGGGGW